MNVGDEIEVIDNHAIWRGKVLELDTHPFSSCYAKVQIMSAAGPQEVWLKIRNARVLARQGSQPKEGK
jgi:hypothetical protein